jgi:acyl transferase domain-containing protein
MKVAHFYPGLKYVSSKIPWRVMKNSHAKDAIHQASRTLGRDVEGTCEREENFRSVQEGQVVSFAVQVAIGRYYRDLKTARHADLIVSSSFGNYAGLVMAGSLEYQDLLDLVSLQGEITDAFYSRHQTLLLKGIPLPAIQTFVATCADVSLISYSRAEGAAITFPAQNLPSILHFIKYSKGKYEEIPLRLPFHSPFPRKLTMTSRPIVDKMHIVPPSIPFLSTYGATMIRSPRRIRDLLVHSVNRPNRILAATGYAVNLGIEKIIYIKTSGVREGR